MYIQRLREIWNALNAVSAPQNIKKIIPQADINDDGDGTLMVLLQLNKNFVTSRRYNYCLKQTNKQKNVWSLLIGMCI